MHHGDVDISAQSGLSRRTVLRRLAGGTAVAWAAPQILLAERASAATHSSCLTTYNFDDGTTQGWSISGSGRSRWQLTTLQANSPSASMWFGRAGTTGSLHPVVGAPDYPGRSRGTLVSPPSLACVGDVISFNVRLAIENSTAYDRLELNIVQGGLRTTIWTKNDPGFPVINHPSNPGAPWDLYTTNGAWWPISVSVPSASGFDFTQPIAFEFSFDTVDNAYNRTEGVFLDDITIPCAPLGNASAIGAEQLQDLQAQTNRQRVQEATYIEGGVLPTGYRAPAETPAPDASSAPPRLTDDPAGL